MPTHVAAGLLADMPPELVEDGKPSQGFARSQRVPLLGGYAWRRYEPHQPSKRFGMDYESWEASGFPASDLAARVRASEVQCTRLDLAWDHHVPDSVSAGSVVEPLADAQMLAPGGAEIGTYGRGDRSTWTWYVGARAASRMLRVYRKDQQDPSSTIALVYKHVLRVELQLRKPDAHPIYQAIQRDPASGWGAASAHVYEMTQRVVDSISDIPEVEAPAEVEAHQALLEVIYQHGPVLQAAREAGVDVDSLVDARCEDLSRKTRWRAAKRLGEFVAMGPDGATLYVLQLLRARLRRRTAPANT